MPQVIAGRDELAKNSGIDPLTDGHAVRNRSLAISTITSGMARVVAVVLNALAIPVAVRSLGVEGYGLWMTVTSISSFLVFADFGLSNGLVAIISEANGKNDQKAAARAVSTTFFALVALAALLCASLAAASPLIPWARLLNLTHSRLAPSVTVAVQTFLCLQIAAIPALVAQKVQIGYQEIHWTNLWQIVGTALSFLGVLFAAWRGLGLISFIVLFGLGPLLAQSMATYVLFGKLRPWLAPRLGAFDCKCARELAGTGGSFVLLQILAVIGSSSDQIILTRYLGLAAVAEYSVAQRLFSGASVIQFFLLPLWPAFGEALARRDHLWARMALRRALTASIALSTGCALLIAFAAPAISAVWVPEIRQASLPLLAAFVAVSLTTAYGGTMSVFLNNRNTIRPQLVFYAVASLGALVAKVWLVSAVGISGVLWGTFLGYGLLYTVPAWKLAKKTLDDLDPASCNQS